MSYPQEKGKIGEREVAEILTNISGVQYRRVPLSGALRMDLPMDLMKKENQPSIFDGIFIEVKNQKTTQLPKWAKNASKACEDAGMRDMYLIAHKINSRWYFTLNQACFEHICTLTKEPTK